MNQNQNKNLIPRPPIVVIMGHVDHGKTTLLDFIRRTNIAAKEAGGITQSIGAYVIEHSSETLRTAQVFDSEAFVPGTQPRGAQTRGGDFAPIKHKITFIDTPGHEAFSKMRARGANVADLAILVVAADDGVKPQTKESIEILQSTKTPFIVAINKIDKPNADIERIKNELTQNGVLLEGYGGNISYQEISAKSGQGVNELLDLILLTAELENFTYNPEAPASGVIIESKTGSRRGISAVAIIKNGTLRTGDEIATATAKGKVKNLANFLREQTKELFPSNPALILGFENMPQIGEEFWAEKDMAKNEAAYACCAECSGICLMKPISSEQAVIPADENKKSDERTAIKIILKADVSGSLEAISEIVKSINNENAKIEIINERVGDISDGDVKTAQATNAIILGFKTRINKMAENLARAQQVKIITSEIIYELLKKIEDELESLKSPKPNNELEVLAIFSQKGKKQVIGGRVIFGAIKNKSHLKILRNDDEVGFGKIMNLQKNKKDVSLVNEKEECGMFFESDTAIQIGDRLIS